METNFTGDHEEQFFPVFLLQEQLSSTELLDQLKSEKLQCKYNINLKLALYNM